MWKEDERNIYVLGMAAENGKVSTEDWFALNVWIKRLYEKFIEGKAMYASPSAYTMRIIDHIIKRAEQDHDMTINKGILHEGKTLTHVVLWNPDTRENPKSEIMEKVSRMFRVFGSVGLKL